MIHNTFLVKMSSRSIVASSQYWPVEVLEDEVFEFLGTREDLRKEEGRLANLPLLIGDDKFIGADVVKDLVLVFVSDKGEEEASLDDRIQSAAKILSKRLVEHGLSDVRENYESLIEGAITTRLKIALVGEGGTGKTTTLHLLLGDTPPLQYVPTIALNLETVENIRFGSYSLVLWDFAGQERFRTLWRFYFHGADVIFLVCDSTLRNVIISKDILKLIKRDAPKVPVFCLANKQDKPNAMKPEVVQKILGVPTYPMVAIDKGRRDEMLRILMTAAAQYVGVALPDVPATELLRFTDEAITDFEEIGEEEEEAEEDLEEDEEYEVIYVDEEGHVVDVEDEEYEIIEEEEEIEVEEVPSIEDDVAMEELSAESHEMDLIKEETEKILPEKEEVTVIEDVSEIDVEEVTIEDEGAVEIEIVPEAEPIQDEEDVFEVPVIADTEINDDGRDIAKHMIFEKLEADEIISAEIERVDEQDIDKAIEAFSSDEALENEDDEPVDVIDTQTMRELESILSAPCDNDDEDKEPVTSEAAETKEDKEETYEEELDELDALFEYYGSSE